MGRALSDPDGPSTVEAARLNNALCKFFHPIKLD
jgi:hypothetical protein